MRTLSIFSNFPLRRYSVTYVLLGCVIWILGFGASCTYAQEVRELHSDHGISGKQPAIFWHDKDAQFDLDSSTNQWNIIIREGSKPPSRVPLPGILNQVYSIRRAAANRIVVLADLSAGAKYVGVIGTDTGTVLDEFWTSADPGISPDNRYILLVRFYPMHGAEGEDDQYRLYDVLGSRAANWPNRPAQASPAGQPDNYDDSMAGIAVYPLDPRERERNNTFVAEGEEHMRASPFVWDGDSKRVVFGDYTGGKLSLIVVTVPSANGQSPQTSVYQVPANQNPCAEFCLPKNVAKLEWRDRSLNVQFTATPKNGPERASSLSLPMSSFIAAER